ncbi:MAG: hypothetical protein AAGD25_08410 [Cyanobacteria bacterium P01_F01_bin.150]
MSSINYQCLFDLSIIHDYYQAKSCPDLSIEPTLECRHILAGHRLLLKRKINGITVITPASPDNKPLLELADDLSFSFLLKVNNSRFFDFTEIDPKFIRTPVGRYLYAFSNEKNTEVGVSSLEGRFVSGNDISHSQASDILGFVKIYNNSSLPKASAQASDYQVSFQAKKHYWYYYLIVDKKNNGDTFLIEDVEGIGEQKLTFTQTKLTEADVADVQPFLGSKFSGKLLYLFKSNSEITCQEAGRRNIQLLKQNEQGSSSIWIEHLPNPPNRTGIQIINTLKSV